MLPNIEDVKVMIVDRGWLDLSDVLWKFKSLKVKVCVTPRSGCGWQTKRRKKALSMPEGWSIIRTYNIQHYEVGEVTNGDFKVEVCGVSGLELLMTKSPHVLGMLVDVLDSTVKGYSL